MSGLPDMIHTVAGRWWSRESIAKRLPPNFNVQIDGDTVSLTTTHNGKPYEITVDASAIDGEFGTHVLAGAIDCCHRFNERGPA